MSGFLVALAVCMLVHGVYTATTAIEWCYHDSSCNDSKWPLITPTCNGSRQSPVNIQSAAATPEASLREFHFTKYDSPSALTTISNTGKTVQVQLGSGVAVSGGGLLEPYDSIQFHLHWGSGYSVPGSEHTVDEKRYPMEFHIVNVKASYHGNTTLAVDDPTGLAALGFFIEAQPGDSMKGSPAGWKTLTSYLTTITEKDDSVAMAPGVSLDDLLVGVDRTKYYRYLGSLTTPTCQQAVVWTVFKDSVKVSADLIGLFSSTIRIGGNESALMMNTFRSIQPDQPVSTSITTGGCLATHYTLGLIAFSLGRLLLWNP